MVVTAVNLGWRLLPVREIVARHTGLPTALGHDVRAGLRAEAEIGIARGVADVAFVPVGTGIAAALQIDGAILSAGGWAGELGHVVVDPAGPHVRVRPARLSGDPCRGAGDRRGVRRPDRPRPGRRRRSPNWPGPATRPPARSGPRPPRRWPEASSCS